MLNFLKLTVIVDKGSKNGHLAILNKVRPSNSGPSDSKLCLTFVLGTMHTI